MKRGREKVEKEKTRWRRKEQTGREGKERGEVWE